MEGIGTTSGGASTRGMSLIEVLVSVVLVSFIGLAAIGMLTSSSRQNRLARERSLATNLAVERMESVGSVPFQSATNFAIYALPEETAASGPPRTLETGYGSIPGFPGFRRKVTLDYDSPVSGMLRLQVEVFWQDLHQGEKRHDLVTYLHPRLEQGQ